MSQGYEMYSVEKKHFKMKECEMVIQYGFS